MTQKLPMSSPRPISEARDRFEQRLGTRLQREGYISADDLEKAIRQQVIMGGHLATNLWELELVGGRALSRLSADILRVSEVDVTETNDLPRKLLDLLPREFVERKHVLPIGIDGHSLCVATSEPWNHLVLGEAGFLSGYPVQPRFMAEVPLMRLLAHYFLIPPHPRFEQPADRSRGAKRGVLRPWEDDLPDLPDDIATVIAVDGKPVKPVVIQPTAPHEEEEDHLEPIESLVEAQRALDAAEDRDAVGAVLMRFALSLGRRVVLFTHRNGQWTGWLGAGEGMDVGGVRQLMLPSEAGTTFGLVSKTGAHYVGPLSKHEVHHHFLSVIGKEVPGSVALLPVHFRGKVVLGIYLDAGQGRDVGTDLAELLVVAQRVPRVLERLIAKRLRTA